MQWQRTKRCTGTAYPLRLRASPTLRACTARAHTPTPLHQSLPPALCPVVCSGASLGTCAFVQVAGASLVQIDVVRACDGGTRTVHVEVDGTGVLCHVHRLAKCTRALTRACGASVGAASLPNRRKTKSSAPRARPACLHGTLAAAACGYSLRHGHSGVRNACSIMVPSRRVLLVAVPVLADAPMLQRHMHEPARARCDVGYRDTT